MPTHECNGKTQTLLICAIALLSLILLGGVFLVGMRVGEYRSTSRAFRHFRRAGFPSGMMSDMQKSRWHGDSRGRHGYGGEVVTLGSGAITVIRRDGSTNTIRFDAETPVQSRGEARSVRDIAVGMHVIAIGKPNPDGDIRATMLLLPAAEMSDDAPGNNLPD